MREIEKKSHCHNKQSKGLDENEFGTTVSLSSEEIKNYIAEISAEIKKKTS